MATFKYLEKTKQENTSINDVLTNGTTSKGTSYYNASSDTQFVYVENEPLTKFLAKVTETEAVNVDIDPNFTIHNTTVGILHDTEGFDLNNVTKETFPNALVSENTNATSGKKFLIAIPSTRTDASSNWERGQFINLFKKTKGATFTPASNAPGASKPNDGDVIITFNGRVKVAILGNADARIEGNTIISDGTNLTVVCTDELYNEISSNGIKSIKLAIVDKRGAKSITMLSGEGFVGE